MAEEHLNQVQELERADDDKLMDGTRVTSWSSHSCLMIAENVYEGSDEALIEGSESQMHNSLKVEKTAMAAYPGVLMNRPFIKLQ